MKKLLLVVLMVLCASVAMAANVNVGAGYYSAYVFRGEKLIDNACLVPSIALVSDKLELRATSIYDSKKQANYRNVYELKFKMDIRKAMMTAGFIAYDQNNLRADTQEFFVGAEWNGSLHPYVTTYFDMKEGTGSYIRGGIERQFKSGKQDKVALGASVGYVINNKYLGLSNGKEFAGFYDGEIYAKASFHTFKHLIVEPVLSYSFPMSTDGKVAIESMSLQNKANNLYGGLNLLVSF